MSRHRYALARSARRVELPGMPSKKAKRQSPQRSVSIPRDIWRDEIEPAMMLDGIDNFSVFALAACRQRAARIRRQQDLDDIQSLEDVRSRLAALTARIENQDK